MKKICLLAAMAMMMVGCSSDNEDKYLADELLAGTEWRYGAFHDDDYLDEDKISEDNMYDDFFETFFLDVQLICTVGEVFQQKRKMYRRMKISNHEPS